MYLEVLQNNEEILTQWSWSSDRDYGIESSPNQIII
jgi:hypothetical protein